MVSTLVKSLVAVILVGAGLVAGRATARNGMVPARAEEKCRIEGRCDATIECKDESCLIRWTAQDGRTGEIELSCKDGECKVVHCDPCCAGGACQPAANSGCCK